MKKLQKRICSIPYYRREQYDLLREASIDKETFSISYEEMMAITESTHRDMESKGFHVVRVYVDIYELLEWATSLSISLNPESRTKFAMEKLKELIFSKSVTVCN
ncbi:dihydroxyacetone kinase subunit DhaK [Thiorhodovibrio frisius]|nr:dihydroxyacetone kinase subunit DhaK [Thiorhodovibrio frisius]